ncbi:5-oxoprolinase subunit PxpA [Ekhidna sp.]|uniref:5-oxoprolinase subunit PxpA n=1 Tax=Ekhidna sp. TaxID=2608089 RepID=UPI003516F147
MTPPQRTIDLNADLGEHPNSNLDEQIMPFISSCNIACGGHIGDEVSVRNTVRLAKQHGVAIGAHPSYPDPENFGRKIMEMQPKDLAESITNQIMLVQRICEEEDVKMHHVKPHGALYNHAAADEFISQLIYEVLREIAPDIYWMGLAHSVSEKIALKNGHPFIAEGFADRQYELDGSLRSRSMEGAVLTANQVIEQVEELAMNQRVKAEKWLGLKVQSICLHGDTAGAVSLAKEINQHLAAKGIQIAAV